MSTKAMQIYQPLWRIFCHYIFTIQRKIWH